MTVTVQPLLADLPLAAAAAADEAVRARAALAVLTGLVQLTEPPGAAAQTPPAGAAATPLAWAAALDDLAAARQAQPATPPWTDREAEAWAACRSQWGRLVDGTPLGTAWLQAHGADGWVWSPLPCAAPPLADAATLLFDGPRWADEGLLVDVVVRWWQQARRAGQPLDDDFGEVWRQLEWTAAAQLLLGLAGPTAAAMPATRQTRRAQQLQALALRYSGLKPLLRLFAPVFSSAPASGSGYTF